MRSPRARTGGQSSKALGATLCLLCSTFALQGLAAEGPDAPAQEPRATTVVAVVNGEPVYADTVERTLVRLHGSVEEGQQAAQDPERLMFRVINDVLIGQEARSLGLADEPPIPDKVEAYRLELAARKLEQEEILERIQVTEKEIEALFERQYSRATFRVVTAYDEPGAQELRQALDEGADIVTLAAERSVDPYRIRGGLVDNVARIDLQRGVADLVFSHEPGQLAGPIRTDLGWSVVRVEAHEPADSEQLPRVKQTLWNLIGQRKVAAARAVLAEGTRESFEVSTDAEAIAALEPIRRPDGRLLPEIVAPTRAVATIGDGLTITAAEYGKELMTAWQGVRNEESARAAAPIVLNRLIEEKLLLAEALARGYDRLPVVDRAVQAHETDLLIPLFLEEVLASRIEISEEELRTWYEERKDEFHRPPRVRLGQVSVSSPEEAERIAELLRGGGDLAWVSKRYSKDRFKDSGGDKGWMVPQLGTTDFNLELMTAEIGTVLDPLGSMDEWIVLMVTDRQEQGIYPYDEVSGNVREAVFSSKFKTSLDQFLTTLRERSEIEVDQAALSMLQVDGTWDSTAATGDGHAEGR